jgi:Cation transport ATPase
MTGWTPTRRKRRLEEYGPNEVPAEPPPSMWVVGRAQLVNPMNIMLLIVVAASFAIVQIATAVVVLGLVTFNVVMGTPGVEGPGQRGGAGQAAGAACPGAALRPGRRDRIDRAGAG